MNEDEQLPLLFPGKKTGLSPRKAGAEKSSSGKPAPVRSAPRKAVTRPTTPGEIARLKVTLKNIRPPIWRRLEVPMSLSFASLHQILQIAFGWTDSHLHQFDTGLRTIGISDHDFDPDFDEKRTRLDYVFHLFRRLIYEYDFGDSWEHLIELESLQPFDEKVNYPRCTGGRRAGPPEDCGGAWGYQQFLESIRDPSDDEHESMMGWIGGDFDSEYFPLDDINRSLSQLSARKRWRRV